MESQVMTMAVLAHPLQALFVGMVVSHGVRALVSVVRQRVRRPGSGSHSTSVAARDLQAA